jgi:hypothetical protein
MSIEGTYSLLMFNLIKLNLDKEFWSGLLKEAAQEIIPIAAGNTLNGGREMISTHIMLNQLHKFISNFHHN